MIPLNIAPTNEELKILKIFLDDKLKKHLENMGILAGSYITIFSEKKGDLIVKVKEGRLALNKDLANKIYVTYN